MRGNLCLVGHDLRQLLGLAQARVRVYVCVHPAKQSAAPDPLRSLSQLLSPLWPATAAAEHGVSSRGQFGSFLGKEMAPGQPGGSPPSIRLFVPPPDF